jgi:MFS family permease
MIPGKNYRWYVVGMLWGISFFNYADRQAIYSVFPLLEQEPFQLTPAEEGLLGSAFAWIYGLGAPFAGSIVDRVRRRTAILGGLQVWSVICVLTAVSTKFWHLLVFRAAEGLGETFYYPASVSLLSDYHGRATRSRALGLHQTSVYAGTVAGAFFAGLISQYYGWRSSFVVFGLLGMLLGVVLNAWLIEPKRGAAEEELGVVTRRLSVAETLSLVFGRPILLLLMLAFVCANAGALVLLSWMPKFMHERFNFDLALAGLHATLLPQTASMVGAALGGWLADRWRQVSAGGRILTQGLGIAAVAPFVVICGTLESLLWVLVALAGWGLFKGVYDSNIFAAAFDFVEPEYRGSVAGFMNMFGWLIGGAPAPLAIGYLSTHLGLAAAIRLSAAVYVAAAVFLLMAAIRSGSNRSLPRGAIIS